MFAWTNAAFEKLKLYMSTTTAGVSLWTVLMSPNNQALLVTLPPPNTEAHRCCASCARNLHRKRAAATANYRQLLGLSRTGCHTVAFTLQESFLRYHLSSRALSTFGLLNVAPGSLVTAYDSQLMPVTRLVGSGNLPTLLVGAGPQATVLVGDFGAAGGAIIHVIDTVLLPSIESLAQFKLVTPSPTPAPSPPLLSFISQPQTQLAAGNCIYLINSLCKSAASPLLGAASCFALLTMTLAAVLVNVLAA